MKSNRFASRLAFGLVVAGTLLPIPAARAGGPNVPYCFALANQYNACMAQAQRPGRGGGWDRGGWDGGGGHGYDHGGGRGWGGHGGYGGYGGDYDDEERYYRQQRRAARAARAQAACAPWLMQMQANRCM